ncbi:AAA family ATPase [Yersinia sp. 2541 StPb PI]|uniref:AAA family ATPase n=1 Tax=Yersinia sp. 2541 StPb PI TaxID=3117407 RepID=UPI003FA48EB8
MISKISAKNFKAFESLDVEIRPITLFLGPNNSGKSSTLALPRLLAQTLQSYDNSIPLLLNGYMGDFGTYKDVIYGNNIRKEMEISISTKSVSPQGYLSSRFKDAGLDQNEEFTLKLKYKYRSGLREIVLKSINICGDNKNIISLKRSDESENYIVTELDDTIIPSEFRSSISKHLRVYNFLPRNMLFNFEINANTALSEFVTSGMRQITRCLGSITDGVHRSLTGLEYLGAMRIPPQRSFLYSGERHSKVGIAGNNAANILAMDEIIKGKKSKGIIPKVAKWLKSAGIASDLKIVHLSDRHYEIKIQHPETKEYENYADVGYGNSQIIPVLTAGYNLSKGQALIVEEPEIHLHPRAQAELAEFILDMYREEKITIVETHSEHLILRLQQHVALGNIPKEDIVFYYSHVMDGKKVLKKLTLDDLGVFKDEWPEGFFPQRLEEAKALARARHSKINTIEKN